ncbi:MAG: 2Fe-2S iron-sulfur cluster-binding protein [Lachnospiraceae bacterium]
MMEIQINGTPCTCEKGEFLLDVARRNGFYIPTLCHHPGISEQGCCRVCLVEVVENKRSKIVVSCVYPVEKPCEVYTNSDKVKENRSVVLMLLKARAPESPEIAALCKAYGAIDGSRFQSLQGEKCILCGLCARACQSLGAGAISTVLRGTQKKISTPYDEPSENCIGCLSCAKVCPTNAIDFSENVNTRSIWGREFPLIHCEKCGEVIGTKEELAAAAKKSGEEVDTLCPACRKKSMADVLAHTYGVE